MGPSSRTKWNGQAKFLSLCLAIISISGCTLCADKQDCHYFASARMDARSAWRNCYSHEKRKCLSAHFERGFKKGFSDTRSGKDCRLPPVAPPRYWSTRYQCCEGQACVQDWFRGYQQGIAVAESQGQKFFNEIPVSPNAPVLNKTACGMCQSVDPCECHLTAYPSDPGYQVLDAEIPPPATTLQGGSEPAEQPLDSESGEADLNEIPIPEPAVAEDVQVRVDEVAPPESQETSEVPGVVREVSPGIGLIGGSGIASGIVGPIDSYVVGAAATSNNQ